MQNNLPKGMIYSIKRYSVHDGPGIRQTVFFKGCPLKCWWCHNPESQDINSENSFIKFVLDGQTFKQDKLIGKLLSIDEVMMEILKDQIFYDESEGGITFSGGEPLLQHKFLNALIKQCKKQGIHTTVDTSGYTDIEVLEEISKHADLFLFDLKHMDDALHKKYTGVSNTKIINNLIWLDVNKKNVIIRIPIIPQINDNEEHIKQMLDFFVRFKSIRKITLLPYHNIASHKYVQLNMKNKMDGVKSLKNKDLNDLKLRFESIGFDVKIGN